MKKVEFSKFPIELFKILKFENMVSSGGQAKHAIAEGRVLVNGEAETRKRKKIVAGDVVEFEGEKLLIQSKEPRNSD